MNERKKVKLSYVTKSENKVMFEMHLLAKKSAAFLSFAFE